ncbi:unnamed protein product [Brachionus calyciflorus]|uniref:Uncharacterized protein n=1 Tax=Brachionus calyciflorus TaxID=104777 RepID=A0A814GC12_9BILA|nr:unnamed protein product [Brachionus calyciflorus]
MSKIPIGTTLIESLPFVHCLIFEKKRILCDYCFLESSKLYQCSKCKFMHYCNANCQRSDWQIHKHECDKFTQFTNNLDLKKEFQNDIVRLYLRILIKSKINDQSNISDEYGLKTFVTLMDHYENLVKDMNRIKTMQKCLSLIKELMGVDFMSKFSIKELISAFGKMVVNTMAVSNYDLSESVGSGLYLSAAYYDHSCEPNSVVTFNGSKVIVRNIRDLEPNEEPVISYCELLMSKKQRQDYLMRCYYFKFLQIRSNLARLGQKSKSHKRQVKV